MIGVFRSPARGHFRPPNIRSIRFFGGGGHVQRWSGGTPASACSTWFPQPAHVSFPHRVHFTRRHMAA